jgi:electron transport complex protein RnfG
VEKNSPVRYALTLGVICLVASGLLGTVHALTQPKIESQKKSQEEASLKEVFPVAESFEAVREGAETVFYKAFDSQKKMLGVVFKASRRGYSSDIVTLAGMDNQGVLVGIKVLSQNETPGLGSQAAEPTFLSQFSGKKVDALGTGVDAISGATITSKAIIDSVQETGQRILEKVKNA